MKKANDTIGNRTLDLPACSAVPQPTASPRAPILILPTSKLRGWVEHLARWEIHNSHWDILKREREQKIGRTRPWEDLVYLNILMFQGMECFKLGRYVYRVP